MADSRNDTSPNAPPSPEDEDMLRAFEGKRPPRPKTTSETDGHAEAAYHAVAAPPPRTATPTPEPLVQIRQIDTDPMAMGVRPPRAQDVPTDPSRRPDAHAGDGGDVSTFEVAPPPVWRQRSALLALAMGCAVAFALLAIAAVRDSTRREELVTPAPSPSPLVSAFGPRGVVSVASVSSSTSVAIAVATVMPSASSGGTPPAFPPASASASAPSAVVPALTAPAVTGPAGTAPAHPRPRANDPQGPRPRSGLETEPASTTTHIKLKEDL